MRVLSQRDCDVLVSANHQLEQVYSAQKAPCLALHIARNYYLLLQQDENINRQQKWRDKAKVWWQLYWEGRTSKILELFYDKNGLFQDINNNLNDNHLHLE